METSAGEIERCAFTGLCPDPGFNALGHQTDDTAEPVEREPVECRGWQGAGVSLPPASVRWSATALGLLPSIALSSAADAINLPATHYAGGELVAGSTGS